MKIVDTNEFKNEIESGVTVVDFFATWCGPCKMLSPVLEGLSGEMEGKAKFIKVDIDQSLDLANEFSNFKRSNNDNIQRWTKSRATYRIFTKRKNSTSN